MKARNLLEIISVFLLAFGFAGCDNNDETGRKTIDYKEYILTVASEEIPGVLTDDGHNILTDVYAVKKEASNEWIPLGSIEGFDFEEGYECVVKIAETTYLDYSMGTPSWTEYKLLEVISQQKTNSEGLPSHFIPKWYYDNKFVPRYMYAVEADEKTPVEEELKTNSILPLEAHYLFYGASKWIILGNDGEILESGILKRVNKGDEELPNSYLILKPEGNIQGCMEWTFMDKSGSEAVYPPFDVLFTIGSKSRDYYIPNLIPHLYYDLTGYYKNKYPEAGVRAVVVSYTIDPEFYIINE